MPIRPQPSGGPARPGLAGQDENLSRADVLRMIQGVSRSTKQSQPVSTKNQKITVFDKLTVDGDLELSSQAAISAAQIALAVPILRGEAGGSIIAGGIGATAGSYVCNMDSTPKAAGTLANQVLSIWDYEPAYDDPPFGYKTQWALKVSYTTNATSPGVTLTWSLWQINSIGGAAGGYQETMNASAASALNVAKTFTGAVQGSQIGNWTDTNQTGGLNDTNLFAFYVNNNGTFAASSAARWRAQLFRRFVPIT